MSFLVGGFSFHIFSQMDGSDCVHTTDQFVCVSIDVYLFICVYECTFILLFNTCSTHRIITLNWFENFPFIWKMKTSLPQFRLLPTVTRENKKTHTERKKSLKAHFSSQQLWDCYYVVQMFERVHSRNSIEKQLSQLQQFYIGRQR